ncbi:MAG: amidohydrolase family protein [Chloroflexi bacterium]|nr:amidohydrolase family protein [Chloroflexota bacterium]
MLLDLHSHVFTEPGILPEWFWRSFKFSVARGLGVSVEQAEKQVFNDAYWDPNGDTLVAEMAKAGVDRAVVLTLDWGLAGLKGEAKYAPERLNEITHRVVQRHKDRLLFGCGVDPRRPNAVEVVEHGIKDLGAKLVKLYPPAGWYANDKAHYRVYEKCIEHNVPIIMHTGPSAAHLLSKYSEASIVEELAADLPELKIICAHSGFGMWRQFAAVAQFKGNIHLEVGAWNREASQHPAKFFEAIREMMDRAPGRVMFSSDYCGFRDTLKPFASTALNLKQRAAEHGIEFTDAEAATFAGGTASKLVGL